MSKRPIDGVLLLDKPVGITSNAALQRVKRLLHAAKAGHVGTLDPLASGLLPVCLGEATKFSAGTFGADKSYDAEILLGVTTTTGDTEGEVTARQSVAVTREQVDLVLRRFTGSIEQTPPMYSALKRDGKPLYAYARAGLTLAISPRTIIIHGITLRHFAADRVQISVRCSKGTYIRTLAEDVGRVLGCGATLAGLRRTAVGTFEVKSAVTLAELEARTAMQQAECLLPVDCLLSSLPELLLEPELVRRLVNGQWGQVENLGHPGCVRLYDLNRRFLGLGELHSEGLLVSKRMVAPRLADASGGSRPEVASL
ncbi:MAG: tRNA pseudouridine(55) synthase TruB [Burkholderiales bacterium]|nr:tRNA pseudouridine(55) synthase TruB [Burkholderiales bacterium]